MTDLSGRRAATDASGQPGCLLSAVQMDFLFPCSFRIDDDLTLRSPSAGLVDLAPDLSGLNLDEVFRFDSGLVISGPADLAQLEGTPVLLHFRRDAALRLRGALCVQPDGAVLFLGAQAIWERQLPTPEPVERPSPLDGSSDLVAALTVERERLRAAHTAIDQLSEARELAVSSQEFYDAIVQMLPAILMVKDARDGRYVLVNRAAEELLGIDGEAMVGRNVFELFQPDEARAFAEEDQAVIASGEMTVVEDEIVTTAAKGRRNFTTKKVATYGDDGARWIVTVGEDVTDRIETAAALQAALAAAEEAALSKSVFLANMSHEIRTPLNGIVAIADILARDDLDPRTHDMVEIIRASGETLERLLSDILDQARIESGQITLEAAPFHLGDMVRATTALADLKAQEKGVAIQIDLSPEVDVAVEGDMVRVRQILTNLLSNAVKFTEQGTITVTGYRTSESRVRLEVRDTGDGFDEETKIRIFGRFQQADNTITRRFGGTGLGLAISRELAVLMGGVLDCEGRVGVGASFWFEVPLPEADDLARSIDLSVEAAAPSQLRILVADDHPTNRRVLELMLEGSAEVICVENGLEAVEAVAADHFDLVLMDMQMPVMDGLTAIRMIRRQETGDERLPIIMLTANALPEHVVASLEAGADRHLDKPITAASLFSTVGELFSERDDARAA